MTSIRKPVLLASAMIGIALLAVLDIVPQAVAQFGPIALLALFPSVWLGQTCTARQEAEA